MEEKPGRYWGVIGRQHLPLGTGEAREAPFMLPGQPRKRALDRMNRIYRISNGVRKESQRHPVHPVNPVKIPLRFISVIVWRTRCRRSGSFCASQLWSEDFTAKLFCKVEFWLERLPKLIGPSASLSKESQMGRHGGFNRSVALET